MCAEVKNHLRQWEESGEPPLLSLIGFDRGDRRHRARGMAACTGYQIMADFDDPAPKLVTVVFRSVSPLHVGSHLQHNNQIIGGLYAIRAFFESVRSQPCRRRLALDGLRGSQKRARLAILDQLAKHMNRIVLNGRTDGHRDMLIDRTFAHKSL